MNNEEENNAELSHWYVIYTYSGYENKVKATLEKIVENRGIKDKISEVIIPMEEEIEIKDGKQKTSKVYLILLELVISHCHLLRKKCKA